MRRFATCAFAAAILLVLFSSLSLAALQRPASNPAEAELALNNLKKRYAEATAETDWKLLAAKGEALMARYGDIGRPTGIPVKQADDTYMLTQQRFGGELSSLLARFYFLAGEWRKLADLEKEVLATYVLWEFGQQRSRAIPYLLLDYSLKQLGKPGLAPEGKPLTLELGDLLLPEVYRLGEGWSVPNPVELPLFELALAMEARIQADLGKDFIALEWQLPRLPGTEELDLRTEKGRKAYEQREREIHNWETGPSYYEKPFWGEPLMLLGAWALSKDTTEALQDFTEACERDDLERALRSIEYVLDLKLDVAFSQMMPFWTSRYVEARKRLLERGAALPLVRTGGATFRPLEREERLLWPLRLVIGSQGGSHKWDLDEATGILAFTTLHSWQDTNEKGFRQYKSEPWHIGLTLGSTQAVVQGTLVELDSAPVLLEGEVWVGVEDAPLLLPEWECVWSEEKQLWSLGRKKTEPDSPNPV